MSDEIKLGTKRAVPSTATFASSGHTSMTNAEFRSAPKTNSNQRSWHLIAVHATIPSKQVSHLHLHQPSGHNRGRLGLVWTVGHQLGRLCIRNIAPEVHHQEKKCYWHDSTRAAATRRRRTPR